MSVTLEEFKVDLDISDILRAMSELQKATQKNADKVEEALKGIGDAAEKIGDEVNKGFKSTKKSTAAAKDELSDFRSSLLKNITAANLLSQAVTGAFSFVSSAIGGAVVSAMEYERSMIQQRIALRQYTKDVDGVSAALESQSTHLETLTGVSQEQIRTLQNKAIALGVNADQTKKLITAAMGLANTLDRDVNEIMIQLTKTLGGQKDETMANIKEVRALTEEQLMNGDAIDIVNEKYGAFASMMTQGDGLSANVTKLSTAFGNMFKAFARAGAESESIAKGMGLMADAMLLTQRAVEKSAEPDSGFNKMLDWSLSMSDAIAGAVIPGYDLMKKAAGFAADAVRDGAEEERRAMKATSDLAQSKLEASLKTDDMAVSVEGLSFNLKKLRERADEAKKANDALASIYNPKEDATASLARQRGLIEGTDEFVGPGRELMDRGTIADQSPMEYMAIQARAQDGMTEIMASNAARRDEIQLREAERLRGHNEKMKEHWGGWNEFLKDNGAQGMEIVAGGVADAWTQMLSGAEVSGKQMVLTIMKALGQQTIASGFAHLAQAGAYLFDPKTVALAGPLAAAAATEITVGSALMMGSLAAAGGKMGRKVPSGGGGRGGGSSARPSLRSPDRGRGDGEFSSKGLVVVINGPTFATEAEIGVAIERARMAARQRGLTQ